MSASEMVAATGPGAGWTAWLSAGRSDRGITSTDGWPASLPRFAAVAVLTAPVCLPTVVRALRWRTA